MYDPYKAFGDQNSYYNSFFSSWFGLGASVALDVQGSEWLIKKFKEGDAESYKLKRQTAAKRLRGRVIGGIQQYSPVEIGPPQRSAAVRGSTHAAFDKWNKRQVKPNYSYKGFKALTKTFTLASFLSFGLEMSTSFFKPGISNVAERNEAKLLEPIAGDSPGAYTQRQRAIMAIHDSQLGIRNVIGSEAGYFHK